MSENDTKKTLCYLRPSCLDLNQQSNFMMNCRLFIRQARQRLPIWPFKTLQMLIQTLLRGNSKYYLMMFFCIFMILFTSNRQRNGLLTGQSDARDSLILAGVRKNKASKEEQPLAEEKKLKENSCSKLSSLLVGNLTINPNITPEFIEVSKQAGKALLKGGCYRPLNCEPEQEVAIIIPFKDREAHLRALLYYLHPMLNRQRAHYCVYVAEQFDDGQFNKAMVMNAAFEEVMKLRRYDCIIFHDVDMIPENDKNLYLCGSQPRHLSPAIDKFEYKPHYGTEFGGVTAITPEQYQRANGHSNEYWGWGGEDNDMEFRIAYSGMKIEPSPLKIGRYKMIVHYHPWQFRPGEYPHNLNKTREYRAKNDGLSDLRYRLVETTKFRTYTKLMIDIRRIDVKRITMFVDGEKAMDVDVKTGEKCRYVAFEGKYLDFKMELTKYEAAQKYRPTLEPLNVPKHVTVQLPKPKEEVRFSLVKTFQDAEELCEKLHPECQGIQAEINNKFSLKKGGVPRNLVVTISGKPQIMQGGKVSKDNKEPKTYKFPAKTAYLKYCPGGGSLQKCEKQIIVDVKKNKSIAQHKYSFEIEFTVLIQPSRYMYYSDLKLLEGEEKVHKNLFTLQWPHGSQAPSFNIPQTPRDYVMKTDKFSFPNIPGTYGIESKIVSRLKHPYFQWRWWVEITSGDKLVDAVVRERYRKNVNRARALNTHKLEVKRKLKQQKKREYLFAKKLAEIQGNAFEIIPEFEEEEEQSIEELVEAIEIGVDQPQFLLEMSDYYNDEYLNMPVVGEAFHVHKQEKKHDGVAQPKGFHIGVAK